MKTEIEIQQDYAQLLVDERKNFDSLMAKYVTVLNDFNAEQNAIKLLLQSFQGRADGFAKQNTSEDNRISNEYLTIISDIQHSIELHAVKG